MRIIMFLVANNMSKILFATIICLFGACVGKHLGPQDTSLYTLKINGEELQILDGQKEFFTNVANQLEMVKIEVQTQGDNHPATDSGSVAGIFVGEDSFVGPMAILDDRGGRLAPSSSNVWLQPGKNTFHIGVMAGDKEKTDIYKLQIYRGLLPKLIYSKILYESPQNDGTIDGTLEVQLQTNDFPQFTFSGATWSLGTEYEIKSVSEVQGQKFPAGIPAGLTMQIKKMDATLISIIFSGRANSHSALDSSFVDVVLRKSAFQRGDDPASSQILKDLLTESIFFRIDMGDAFLRSSTSFFEEDVVNAGYFAPSSVKLHTTLVDFSVEKNTYLQPEVHYKVRDIPKGLSIEIFCTSSNQAILYLRGYAYMHKKKDNEKFVVQFLDAAFKEISAENVSGSYQIFSLLFRDE